MRAAKVQASLCICAVLPEPLLLAHTSSESRGTFRQKARSLAPLNSWACAVKICQDRMLEDTNSLDGAQMEIVNLVKMNLWVHYFNTKCMTEYFCVANFAVLSEKPEDIFLADFNFFAASNAREK